jgi:heme A synthase
MIAFIQWLQSTPLSLSVRRIGWLIPMMQTLHILANGLVLSAIIMIDLRVWRRAGTEPLADRVRRLLPWLWSALGVLTATGLVLVLGTPRRTLLDPTFQAKMLIMAVAIVATVALAAMLRRTAPEHVAPEPASARRMPGVAASVVGAATLLLWLGATIAGRGRWIANVIG